LNNSDVPPAITQATLRHHVFVCTGTACSNNDSQATLERFWAELTTRGLLYGKPGGKRGQPDGTIIVTTCGSVGLCAAGPAVLIYPDGVWYARVTAEDVPEIVQKHLIGGHPVERLLALKVHSD